MSAAGMRAIYGKLAERSAQASTPGMVVFVAIGFILITSVIGINGLQKILAVG